MMQPRQKLLAIVSASLACNLYLVVPVLLATSLAVALAAQQSTVQQKGPLHDLGLFGYEPQTAPQYDPDNGTMTNLFVVPSCNVRFTVLSPYLFRMEHGIVTGNESMFEDRATISILNRQTHASYPRSMKNTTTGSGIGGGPVASYDEDNNTLSIVTIAGLNLVYDKTMGTGFHQKNLHIFRLGSGGADVRLIYRYGDVDHGNLLGTVRSLDEVCTVNLNCTVNKGMLIHNESLHCAMGLISLNGWTTLEDTGNYIMGDQPGDWFSASDRNIDAVDLYFFGHGTGYKAALYDYTSLSGHSPIPPKSLMGSWWTRWFDFNNADLDRLLTRNFKGNQLPLDTLVLDMNWHTKNDWTGWSWDETLYPNPVNYTMAMIKNKFGTLLSFCNVHDADGVSNWEVEFANFCEALGVDPNSTTNIPFQPLNASYMRLLDDVVLLPTGFDYYWIDWQQGGWAGNCTGGRLNPTMITDHVRGTDHMRRALERSQQAQVKRDAILARFGGYGAQRYNMGFSGDVSKVAWECFAFQPYFSLTAANVAYGLISHDLIGPAFDHELHVRIMQFGAFSGVMRVHDRGLSSGGCSQAYPPLCGIVNLWRLPNFYFDIIRDAMRMREMLLPHIYTAMHRAYREGLPLFYPMYYEWPTSAGAYRASADFDSNAAAYWGFETDSTGSHTQGFFGSGSLIVAPITFHTLPKAQHPDPTNTTAPFYYEGLLANKTVWLPPAQGRGWFDLAYGDLIDTDSQGNQTESEGLSVTRGYVLEDVPLFARGGSVLIRRPEDAVQEHHMGGAHNPVFDDLEFHVFPSLEWAQPGCPAITTHDSAVLYEDDGMTYDYVNQDEAAYMEIEGKYSRTQHPGEGLSTPAANCSVDFSFDVSVVTLPTIPLVGTNASRRLRLRIFAEYPPSQLLVNGQPASFELFAPLAPSTRPTWSYDGKTMSVLIDCGSGFQFNQLGTALTVNALFVTLAELPLATLPMTALFSRVDFAKRLLDEALLTPAQTAVGPGYLKQAASRALNISYHAGQPSLSVFYDTVLSYHALVEKAYGEIALHKPTTTTFYQLWNIEKFDMLLCGTVSCILENPTYQTLWVEGYQALYDGQDKDNTLQLLNYFNSEKFDSWTLPANITLPSDSGYDPTPPYYHDGFLLKSPPPPNGTGGPYACVEVWYNAQGEDHMTVISLQGRKQAEQNGYVQVYACVGYGYTVDPFLWSSGKGEEAHQVRQPAEPLSTTHALRWIIGEERAMQSKTVPVDVVSRAAALIASALFP